MNHNNNTVAYHVERAKRLQKRNERRANALTACGIIAAVAVIAVLLAGAGKPREYTEEVITVRSGDTLWNIADAYCPDNMDKREFIRIIEADNECDAVIRVGDVLTVRRYAD